MYKHVILLWLSYYLPSISKPHLLHKYKQNYQLLLRITISFYMHVTKYPVVKLIPDSWQAFLRWLMANNA